MRTRQEENSVMNDVWTECNETLSSGHEEHVHKTVNCTKRMKQQVEMFKQTAGKSVLYEFAEATADCQKETDEAKQKKSRDESFNEWMGHICMTNSDCKKHGSLKQNLQAQHSVKFLMSYVSFVLCLLTSYVF